MFIKHADLFPTTEVYVTYLVKNRSDISVIFPALFEKQAKKTSARYHKSSLPAEVFGYKRKIKETGSFFKDFIYLFLEREKGREKERERNINV